MASLDALRRAATGQFLALSGGLTYVVDEGPREGRALVLVHGATVPHWEFDHLLPHLRAAGWRIVRFDLFGHGLSDRPEVRYDFRLFLQQVLEVVDTLGAVPGVTLLGHSFGAALAAEVAARRPERIERLVLVAPLLDFMTGAWWPRVLALPGVGAPFMRQFGLPALRRRRRRRYSAIGASALASRFLAESRAPGYAEALASMFANRTLGDQSGRYRALHAARHPIAVVAGAEDRVVPLSDVARVRALLPPHRYLELAGAGHNLLLTHPEHVAPALAPSAADAS